VNKSRERWSDEEHQRFLDALKLHGRQWRKIEGEWLFLD
jgi:SHAQKYF class myb-like DNA-binding protein